MYITYNHTTVTMRGRERETVQWLELCCTQQSVSPSNMDDLEACSKLKNAVKQGNMTRVEEALDMEGVNPNLRWSRDITSHTPLTCAVEMSRPDIIKLLLTHPNIQPNLNGLDGFTPLTLAVTKGSKEMVLVLLENPGCDPNLREGGGLTALHLAIIYNNTEIVKILAEDERTVKDMKVEGQTPLQLASSLDTPNQEIVELLK